MTKRIIILGLNILLLGCMSNDASREQTEWYKSFENKPLTEKEKTYVKLLEDRGFSRIDIQPPTIGVDFSGSSNYSIAMKSQLVYTANNKDSIRAISHEIARELYKDIVEDSILFDISRISVTIGVKNNFKKDTERDFYQLYNKRKLGAEVGFRVIKKSDGIFERVQN